MKGGTRFGGCVRRPVPRRAWNRHFPSFSKSYPRPSNRHFELSSRAIPVNCALPAGTRFISSGERGWQTRFDILVRDNGCGIDPHVLNSGREGHWGLSGMRERAERIGARLRVLSRTDAGTEIELSVPSRMAFEPGVSKRPKLWFSKLYSREARKDKRPESESVHR